MDDFELLQQYLRARDDAAFAVVVRRHIDLVYSSAVRQLRDAQLAADAVQVVFALLAQRAAELHPPIVLAGWLMRTTRFVCLDIARARKRRARTELQGGELRPMTTEATQNFDTDRQVLSEQI